MTELLRAESTMEALGVDRDAKTIRGVIVAEEGPFRDATRGEFDKRAIKRIVALGRAAKNGLRSRLSHPESADKQILNLLGRVRNFVEDTVTRNINGEKTQVLVARGDLVFGDYAFATPQGDLASHVMAIVEEDPDGLGMSLELQTEKTYRSTGGAYNRGAPLWNPVELVSADVVGKGEATRSMLAAAEVYDEGFDADILARQLNLKRKSLLTR